MTGKAHSCMEVRLEEVRFHAYHGLLPQEAKVGNDFEADIVVTVPDFGAADDDSLDNSLCYAVLFEVVEEEMRTPSGTLEHLTRRIGRAIIERWPWVAGVDVGVCKIAPPIPGFRGRARVVWHYRSEKIVAN